MLFRSSEPGDSDETPSESQPPTSVNPEEPEGSTCFDEPDEPDFSGNEPEEDSEAG